ncbi:MAG: hypothetical protein Q7R64_02210 [bacterium]|nr:hypothetical protein [bacterium]
MNESFEDVGGDAEAKIDRSAVEKQVRQVRSAVMTGTDTTSRQAYSELVAFAQKFQSKVPDWERYRLYHIFIGSTPPGSADLFDVEGPLAEEFSIARFAESLTERFKLKTEEN